MFRVIYNRVYGDSKEAEKAARSISELHPIVKSGKGSYVVELGQYKTRQQADSAYFAFKNQGHRVFIQNMGDK